MRIAVVGATGVVGQVMLELLGQRAFPVDEIRPLASSRSAGRTVRACDADWTVQEATATAFDDIDLALFSAGSGLARELAPAARAAGALIVDNSSAFRMDPDCPLVVPEINGDTLAEHHGIIANPNCSTILLCMALAPLHRAAGVRRVVVCSYQAVSGAGQRALEELDSEQSLGVFPKPIARNVIPWVQAFEEDGYSTEETKVCNETRRILGVADLPVAATCVRVPVRTAHAEAVHVELERPLSPAEATELLSATDGIRVRAGDDFPTPREVEGTDEVQIGRIRVDRAFQPGLALWCVMDQLRKGAALNAIQIAERALGVGAGA